MSQDARRFAAPWSASLHWVTWLSCALLMAFPVASWAVVPKTSAVSVGVGTAASLLSLGTIAVFTVRGYRLEGRTLLVERLLWSTRVPLDGLRTAEVVPEAMRRSIRLFGNGGLFVFAGWFRNRRLGRYRAWATDPARSVVLHFPNRRIVVTPKDPHRFAHMLGVVHR